jgi:hypothetical protein
VEPACGVSLAAIYSNLLPLVLEEHGHDSTSGPIVIIVCGGSDVTPYMLMDYIKMFNLDQSEWILSYHENENLL